MNTEKKSYVGTEGKLHKGDFS